MALGRSHFWARVSNCLAIAQGIQFLQDRIMTPAALKKHLLSMPSATVNVQWGDDHVYKVCGKMFAVADAKHTRLSFKASDDSFEILTQIDGIVPAPYLARAKWVKTDRLNRLPDSELKAYLTRAHALIAAKLTKKLRAELGLG
jgi:predicted DNA-binding protein (MmcQ/YjbR family)